MELVRIKVRVKVRARARVRARVRVRVRVRVGRRLGACKVGEPVGKIEGDVRLRELGFGQDGLAELCEEGSGRRLSLHNPIQSV